jgi:tRNA(adenine34) deaminase
MTDEAFMREALALARVAETAGEVPVGALVVVGERILGRGYNAPISRNDPTAHAEMTAIRDAALHMGNYRLSGASLYVTMEPCVMCAGAIVHARIDRLVFAARDLRFGGVRSKFRLADSDLLNHRVDIVEGVCGPESIGMLQAFFSKRR